VSTLEELRQLAVELLYEDETFLREMMTTYGDAGQTKLQNLANQVIEKVNELHELYDSEEKITEEIHLFVRELRQNLS